MTSFASYPRDHAARVELLPSHSGGVVAGETKPRLCLAQVIAREMAVELATVAGLVSASQARRDDAAQVLAAIIRAKEAA